MEAPRALTPTEQDLKKLDRFSVPQKLAALAAGAALAFAAGCKSPEAGATNPTPNPGETTTEVVIDDSESNETLQEYPASVAEYLATPESGYNPDECSLNYLNKTIPVDLDADGKIKKGEEVNFWSTDNPVYGFDVDAYIDSQGNVIEGLKNHLKRFSVKDGEFICFATEQYGFSASDNYAEYISTKYLTATDAQVSDYYVDNPNNSPEHEAVAKELAVKVVDTLMAEAVNGGFAHAYDIEGYSKDNELTTPKLEEYSDSMTKAFFGGEEGVGSDIIEQYLSIGQDIQTRDDRLIEVKTGIHDYGESLYEDDTRALTFQGTVEEGTVVTIGPTLELTFESGAVETVDLPVIDVDYTLFGNTIQVNRIVESSELYQY